MGPTTSAEFHYGVFIKLLNDALSNSNEMEDSNEVGANKLDEKYFSVCSVMLLKTMKDTVNK